MPFIGLVLKLPGHITVQVPLPRTDFPVIPNHRPQTVKGLKVDQQLLLRPGEGTARNHLTVIQKLFGGQRVHIIFSVMDPENIVLTDFFPVHENRVFIDQEHLLALGQITF